MSATLAQTAPTFNRVPRKPVQKTRHFLTTSPFIQVVCERIFRDWLRGVSELSLSKAYGVTREAIEQTVRAQVQETLAAARKPAFAVGVALLFCVGFESWQESQSGDEQTIQRAFRTSRARRSRRDGEGDDSVWGPMHNPPEWLNQEAA